MQRKPPDAIINMSNFKEMRAVGIELAAKKVLDEDYEEAKRLFAEGIGLSF